MARQFDNTDKLTNLYYAIGYYLKRKGLSQEQLAEELGVSRQHLASIDAPNMNRGLSLDLLFNIASVLEIEPYLLLKFNPEKWGCKKTVLKGRRGSPKGELLRFFIKKQLAP